MRILTGEEVQKLLAGIIYADRQRQKRSFDLTVKVICRLKSPGALDFGGSEFKPTELEVQKERRRNPGDKYGWWELSPGEYMVRFNETLSLPEGYVAMLVPHERLLRAGATHPLLFLQTGEVPSEVPLVVPSVGLQIKENARISTVAVWST